MTPSELITFALQRHNAVGDSLFSNDLMLSLMYAACQDIAKKAYVIEQTYSTTTVASTQEYAFPTNAFAIKRVTYDGMKLTPITFREDDSLSLQNSTTIVTGTPNYYATFNRTIYLRPVPGDALTLKLFTYNMPSEIDTTSTLEVPTEYHTDLALYMLAEMNAMEKNYQGAQYYLGLWDKRVEAIKKEQRKRNRGDAFQGIQDIDSMPSNIVDLV